MNQSSKPNLTMEMFFFHWEQVRLKHCCAYIFITNTGEQISSSRKRRPDRNPAASTQHYIVSNVPIKASLFVHLINKSLCLMVVSALCNQILLKKTKKTTVSTTQASRHPCNWEALVWERRARKEVKCKISTSNYHFYSEMQLCSTI